MLSLFAALLRCRRSVEGFRVWHFDAQWSPGLANSLKRDVISGAESRYPLLELLALLCCVVSGVRRDSQLVRPSLT